MQGDSHWISAGAAGPIPAMGRMICTGGSRKASSWEILAGVANCTLPMQRAANSDPYYWNRTEHGKVPANVRAVAALKFIVLVPRPAHISPEQFHEHWLERHSQLARSVASHLRIKRYVQSHVVTSPTIEGFGAARNWTPNPYSGMTECWWENETEMAAAFASEEGQRASRLLAEDERKITDDSVVVWAAREYEIFNFCAS